MKRGKANGQNSAAKQKSGPRVTLDFTGRESLYQEVVQIAEREERSVPAQIMFWMKRHIGMYVAIDDEIEKRIKGDQNANG